MSDKYQVNEVQTYDLDHDNRYSQGNTHALT